MANQYDVFAEVYDVLFDELLYYDWKNYVLANLEGYQVKPTTEAPIRILDVACGNGDLALLLRDEPFLTVSGYDLSAKMVSQAKQNALSLGVTDVNFFEADMLQYQDPNAYEVITLFCDTLCYLDSEQAIKQTFTNIFNSLTRKGLFMFDIHSAFKINHDYPGFTFVQEWDDAVFTWNSEQVRGENTIDHMLNMFVQVDDSSLYERHEELHQEQIFPLITYQRLLTEAGFENIKITTDFSAIDEPNELSERIFFACQKV